MVHSLLKSVLFLTTAVCSAEYFHSYFTHTLLGKAIYLPKENLLGSIPNGISFFKDIPLKCLRTVILAANVKDQSFYKNTEELYKKIATETGLDPKYEGHFLLGASLDITTQGVSGSKREVTGTSLNLASKAFEQQLKPNCLYETEIYSRIGHDFSTLQKKITAPWHKSSWRDYQRFLNTHGSHVITAVTFGASIDQYAFAEQSSSYTARDFTVKACASLAKNITVSSISVSACSTVTSEEIHKIANERIMSSITVRGGSSATRQKLLYDRYNGIIVQFLKEGHINPTPIQYTLTPVWQILEDKKEYRVQAINLKNYFDGFLNFGCNYIKGKRGPSLQFFNFARHSTETNPVFECTIAPPGCHHDNDCHYTLGIYCSCYGDSCIRHTEMKTSSGISRPHATQHYSSGWRWQGCGWLIPGTVCKCAEEDTTRRMVWPDSSEYNSEKKLNAMPYETRILEN